MSSPGGSYNGATRSTSVTSFFAAYSPSSDICEEHAGAEQKFLRNGKGGENARTTATKDRGGGGTRKEKLKRFFVKYFLQGQQYSDELNADEENGGKMARRIEEFVEDNRKYIAFFLPVLFLQTLWWTLAVRYDFFRLFPTHYELPLTMILGATVAGMTSEGGGAVAFPVMTLLLQINPIVARDFSLMIQSCGMTSAAFTILWMRIKLEWHSIILCTLGSTAGIIFGLEWVDQLLTGPEKKMLFVSIWFSFAVSLFVLNMQHKRRTYSSIVNFNWWAALALYATGFFGGLCSAFSGSGVDICSFSILTLLFRVSEKVATPTSVILMAANTCVGFFWRHLIMSEVSKLAWDYFTCSVPVVVICAPLGSFLASHFHRLVLATFVYVLEVVAVLGFLATRPQPYLVLTGAIIVLASFIFFLILSRIGQRLHDPVATPTGADGKGKRGAKRGEPTTTNNNKNAGGGGNFRVGCRQMGQMTTTMEDISGGKGNDTENSKMLASSADNGQQEQQATDKSSSSSSSLPPSPSISPPSFP